MIGYAMLGSNNCERALDFYDKLLAPLGAKRVINFATFVVYGADDSKGAMLGVCRPHNKQPASYGNGTMIALQMPSKEKVDEMHARALSLGATDEGAVGPRDETFYAGYFRDLDHNKLCFYYAPGT